MKPISDQHRTGETTEAAVTRHFTAIGLTATKPIPDKGIDLNVSLPVAGSPVLKVQIKGRGPNQRNKKYRWFQIRTTAAQRQRAEAKGICPSDIWEERVRICDFFVLVAQRYDEFWVLPKKDIIAIGRANRHVYGNRADNCTGKQAELDLDIEAGGTPLTKIYSKHCNAFQLVKDELERRMAEQIRQPDW